MFKKISIVLFASALSGLGLASYYELANHSHDSSEPLSHSGGLDSKGGHNCSDTSKQKGLCTGYHYHR